MPPFGVVLGKELREERGDWHLARLLLYLALWQIPPSTRSTGESDEGGDELRNRPSLSRLRSFLGAGSSPSALCLAAGGNCGLKTYPKSLCRTPSSSRRRRSKKESWRAEELAPAPHPGDAVGRRGCFRRRLVT